MFQEDLRICICQFCKYHLDKPKSLAVKHFLDEGVPYIMFLNVLTNIEAQIEKKEIIVWQTKWRRSIYPNLKGIFIVS